MKRKSLLLVSFVLTLLMVFSSVGSALAGSVQVKSISLNKAILILAVGKTETLTALVSPANSTNKVVAWSSSNDKIAKVDGKGVVTGVKLGRATITAKAKDGGAIAKCVVTVSQYAFPLKKPITLKYWIYFNCDATMFLKSYNDMTMYKEAEKATGVHIDFIHPTIGQERDQFNIMVASRNLPDMIYFAWDTYTGGVQKAYQDGVVIKLNDLLGKYSPNISAFLAKRNDVLKTLKTDDGGIFDFPGVYEGDALTKWYGPQIRKDWLKKLSISVPKTMDDWYNMLKQFREKDPNGNGKKDEVPFVTQNLEAYDVGKQFLGAWQIPYEFYQQNGKVKFGAIQPEFKEYLKTMNKWYKEGLLDSEFSTTDDKTFDANISNGLGGSWMAGAMGGIGHFTSLMKTVDPNFDIATAPFPSLKKGDNANVYGVGSSLIESGVGAALTPANKYPELSAMWLDFFYGDKGILLANYGIEGKSYTMVNGKPKYTDEITKNPKGLDMGTSLLKYTHISSGGAFIQTNDFWKQCLTLPAQIDSLTDWSMAKSQNKLPSVTISQDESQDYADIMNNVETYLKEMVDKFIMGKVSIDKFDDYVKQIKSMGIDKAIAMKQEGYERYLAK